MKNIPLTSITNFNGLSSFIINTTSPTVLAFSAPNTFGQYWLKRMEQTMDTLFTPDLDFKINIIQERDELAVLVKESGGPVIFFIKDRQLIAKSMGSVSEKDFRSQLNNIYSISQAA